MDENTHNETHIDIEKRLKAIEEKLGFRKKSQTSNESETPKPDTSK